MKKSGLMSLKSIDLARYGKKNNECHSLTSLIDDPSMKFIVFLRLMLNWSKNLSVFREIPDIIPLLKQKYALGCASQYHILSCRKFLGPQLFRLLLVPKCFTKCKNPKVLKCVSNMI